MKIARLAYLLLAVALPAAAARKVPETVPVSEVRKGVFERDYGVPTSRAMRARVLKALPKTGSLTKVWTAGMGLAEHALTDATHSIRMQSSDYHAVGWTAAEARGTGKGWTRRFTRGGGGFFAGSFSPDGKRASLRNEETLTQYHFNSTPLTHFTETADVREIGPGKFDVVYRATLSDQAPVHPTYDNRYKPGTYERRMTISLTQPHTLAEMWHGNESLGLDLKQAILHAARVRTFTNTMNMPITKRGYGGTPKYSAWTDDVR